MNLRLSILNDLNEIKEGRRKQLVPSMQRELDLQARGYVKV